jgi:hypothetical protein
LAVALPGVPEGFISTGGALLMGAEFWALATAKANSAMDAQLLHDGSPMPVGPDLDGG